MHVLANVDFFGDLWLAAKQASPFSTMVLLAVLYFVNDERKQLIKKNEALTERLLTTTSNAVDAISRTSRVLAKAARED